MATLQQKKNKSVVISGRQIGEFQPAFLVAEIGGNFRTLKEAFEEIRLAADCGVDAVKIQTFRAENLVAKGIRFSKIAGGANQYDIFKQHEVSENWHREIFAFAKQKKLIAFSTPSYYDDVDLLMKLDVPAIKIGSDDLTNLPFLKYAASTRKPLLISTGMADFNEVQEAVDTLLATGPTPLIVLHCVSQYPVLDPKDLNLKAIPELSRRLHVPVGFSDHTAGTLASCLAVALGACVIEKHFVLDQKINTPDAFFSMDPEGLQKLVQEIRETEKALGTSEKKPTSEEMENRRDVRKSLIAKTRISKGTILKPEHLIIKRPGYGIEPKRIEEVLGKRVTKNLEPDDLLTWEVLESS